MLHSQRLIDQRQVIGGQGACHLSAHVQFWEEGQITVGRRVITLGVASIPAGERQAVLLHQAVQIGMIKVLAGQDEGDLTAALQIGADELQLILGQILGGLVDEQNLAVIRNLPLPQQTQLLRFKVALGQPLGQLSAQGRLAVVGQGVNLVAGAGHHRINGAGQLTISIELGVGGAAGVVAGIVVGHQDVVKGDGVGLILPLALDNDGVGLTIIFL